MPIITLNQQIIKLLQPVTSRSNRCEYNRNGQDVFNQVERIARNGEAYKYKSIILLKTRYPCFTKQMIKIYKHTDFIRRYVYLDNPDLVLHTCLYLATTDIKALADTCSSMRKYVVNSKLCPAIMMTDIAFNIYTDNLITQFKALYTAHSYFIYSGLWDMIKNFPFYRCGKMNPDLQLLKSFRNHAENPYNHDYNKYNYDDFIRYDSIIEILEKRIKTTPSLSIIFGLTNIPHKRYTTPAIKNTDYTHRKTRRYPSRSSNLEIKIIK